MHLHSSDEVSACYEHPAYPEDNCPEHEKILYPTEVIPSLSSKEAVLAEILREKLLEKSKATPNLMEKFVGIGWILASDEQLLNSFKRARYDLNAMTL